MIAGVGDEHLFLSHPAAKAKISLEQTQSGPKAGD
jgi:hypothetical protein